MYDNEQRLINNKYDLSYSRDHDAKLIRLTHYKNGD